MRIESVRAHAFGPFVDRSLELAPGMTVICGPNESGKSTWHAALYAALCGMRRGRGRRSEDSEFADRHHPWDAANWEVSTIVGLEDGRRVELRHDLDGRVDCQARDVDLGRDYSSEIINDGAPDGARWLGLDRRSFLGTACVGQADIQSIVDHANSLQEHMQRAAATAGTDSTAAAALARLEQFHRENVGLDRANSSRPLRTAKNTLQDSQIQLERARESHAEYVRQMAEVEDLEYEVNLAEHNLQLVEAARMRMEAKAAEISLERARELGSKYPDAPPAEDEEEELAQDARLTLDRWNNRPAYVELIGPSATELEEQIAQLPSMPDGDTTLHPDVQRAKTEYLLANASLERHRRNRPPESVQVDSGGLDATEVRGIASELRLEEPVLDPVLQDRVFRAQERVDSFSERGTRSGERPKLTKVPLLVRPFVMLARLVMIIITTVFGRRPRSEDSGDRLRALEELRDAEAKLGDVRFQASDGRRRRDGARSKAADHGLPNDPETLTQLAQQIEQATQDGQNLERWSERQDEFQAESSKRETELEEILRSRGVTNLHPVSVALEAYEAACAERDQQARTASQKNHLESALESKKREEATAADIERRRNESNSSLQEIARQVALPDANDEELAVELKEWLEAYARLAENRRRAVEEWGELEDLLGGGSIQDLEETVAQKKRTVEKFAQGLDDHEVGNAVLDDDIEAQLRVLRQDRSARREALADKRARLDEYGRKVPIVAEAEEEVSEAEEELERVRGLDWTLATTREFLTQAQDKIHRTLAPLLRDALKPWLNAITGGRYTDVTVDVESLMVQVSGTEGNWRNVALLSHGTAEQIYLLLRVTMARLLTRAGEVCPLLFDDVTVHCDTARQNEILNILHTVSREQQVILFSQEPETLAWAREHLSNEMDRLIELDPSGIPA